MLVGAIQRMGQLLEQIEKAQGGDRGGRGKPSGGVRPLVSRSQSARDAVLSEHEKKTAPSADREVVGGSPRKPRVISTANLLGHQMLPSKRQLYWTLASPKSSHPKLAHVGGAAQVLSCFTSGRLR
jgi:hypothetical protein